MGKGNKDARIAQSQAAADSKKATATAQSAQAEAGKWDTGSKDSSKKADAEAKKAEAARKKAERDAALKEEEAATPSKAKGGNAKAAVKKTRGLDLAQLEDEPASSKPTTLNASGIDNALDALSLTNSTGNSKQVERHAEKRVKAAFAAYEERRMPELEKEHPGLRKNQRQDMIWKEFKKSAENPINQAKVSYDASKDEIKASKVAEKDKIEQRLGGGD